LRSQSKLEHSRLSGEIPAFEHACMPDYQVSPYGLISTLNDHAERG